VLLLTDHPTTGGYPVLAVVVAADLPAAGQLRPGDGVAFRPARGALTDPAPRAPRPCCAGR